MAHQEKPQNFNVSAVSFENSKWTKNEIISVVVFAAVVVCWMIVGIWPKAFAAALHRSYSWQLHLYRIVFGFAARIIPQENARVNLIFIFSGKKTTKGAWITRTLVKNYPSAQAETALLSDFIFEMKH